MVSIIGIAATFPLIFVFGLCFALTLRSHLKNPHTSKIFFMLSFLSIMGTYICWAGRILILPQFISENEINSLYPFWAVAYFLAGTSFVMLDFATFSLMQEKQTTLSKILISIIIITYIIAIIILSIGFEVELIVFSDVSDLTIKNIYVYLFFTCILLFYFSIPNAINIKFLLTSEDKNTFVYKRVRIIEFGILLFSIGMIFDGLRFAFLFANFIGRIIAAIGGLLIVKGFLMKKGEN